MEFRVSTFFIPREPWNLATAGGGPWSECGPCGEGRGGYPEGNKDTGNTSVPREKLESHCLLPLLLIVSFLGPIKYSCTFPEMVDKLILLDALPCVLDYKVRIKAFMRTVMGETQAPR